MALMDAEQRSKRREELYGLLGQLPAREREIGVQRVGDEIREDRGYVLEKLVLDLNGLEQVPAYFVRPLEPNGPMPAVLYNHAHGGRYEIGKDELLDGRPAIQNPPYAEALCARGWASLCIDHWAFGERRGRTESAIFKEMLWRGRCMWGMMVYDSLKALDYLTAREDVDGARIATVGLSMGSTMAWWVAALDERVSACVDICCLTDFQALIDTGGLDGHGIYYYVPDLLNHFSTAQINSLIAPRPHLSLAGEYDPLTPVAGLERIDRELREVYKAAGASDAWELARYQTGHMETTAMRARIMGFLEAGLAG